MDSTHFKVTKEKYGISLKGNASRFHEYLTREEHKKYWKSKVGKTLAKEDFWVETFPGVGDGYFDSDYATPRGYKCTEEYK